jgi:hypothetical protein
MKLEKQIYLILKLLKKCIEENLQFEEELLEEYSIAEILPTLQLLQNQELITGLKTKATFGEPIVNLDNVIITLKGIDYINNNSTMNKIKTMFKDIKGIIK